MVVGGGVVFRWVVIPLVVDNDNVSFKLELGIGGTRRVLIRTVVGGSLRQIWRGGEAEVEGIEVWGAVGGIPFAYIVMGVHGRGGIVGACNLCNES